METRGVECYASQPLAISMHSTYSGQFTAVLVYHNDLLSECAR